MQSCQHPRAGDELKVMVCLPQDSALRCGLQLDFNSPHEPETGTGDKASGPPFQGKTLDVRC